MRRNKFKHFNSYVFRLALAEFICISPGGTIFTLALYKYIVATTSTRGDCCIHYQANISKTRYSLTTITPVMLCGLRLYGGNVSIQGKTVRDAFP